jgi:hypothetical protein
LRQQIGDRGPFARIVDLIDVVDEQYRSAAGTKLNNSAWEPAQPIV